MPSETSAADPVPTFAPTVVAPPRERRLVPVPPTSRKRPVTAVAVKRPVATARAVPVSAVETKVAGLQDPDEILKVVHTEAVLRRAQRLSGQGDSQRQTIRLLSVCMLFALLAAAVGAMWYLQTSLQGSRRARRPAAAASNAGQPPADHGTPAAR